MQRCIARCCNLFGGLPACPQYRSWLGCIASGPGKVLALAQTPSSTVFCLMLRGSSISSSIVLLVLSAALRLLIGCLVYASSTPILLPTARSLWPLLLPLLSGPGWGCIPCRAICSFGNGLLSLLQLSYRKWPVALRSPYLSQIIATTTIV